jgi:hypothetical protein
MNLGSHWRRLIRYLKRYVWPLFKATALFLLIFCPTFILGAVGERAVQEMVGKDWQEIYRWDFWRPYLIWSLLLLPLLFGLAWRTIELDHGYRVARLYKDLGDFYQKMKFGDVAAQEIRCVIWVPMPAGPDQMPIYMRQLTLYYPEYSRIGEGLRRTYRQNEVPPRYFKVSKHEGDNITPIGVLGYCVHRCLLENNDSGKVIAVPDGEHEVAYNVGHFNFSARQARKLTPGRRCFMFLPVMNSDKTKVLAILFCDSCDGQAFTEATLKKAITHLPMLAKSLLP